MPPLQALVALHGLWALVLLPFVVWAVRCWQPRRLRLAGCALTGVALLGLAILIGHELLSWYSAVSAAQEKYIAPRLLYVLGTNTDLPVVQVLVAGMVLWVAARRRMCRVARAEAEPRPGEGIG